MATLNKCPGCGSEITLDDRLNFYTIKDRLFPRVFECPACAAVLGECSMEDSDRIVSPEWSDDPNTDMENWVYYDLDVAHLGTVYRRHGWFNRQDRKILQTG